MEKIKRHGKGRPLFPPSNREQLPPAESAAKENIRKTTLEPPLTGHSPLKRTSGRVKAANEAGCSMPGNSGGTAQCRPEILFLQGFGAFLFI